MQTLPAVSPCSGVRSDSAKVFAPAGRYCPRPARTRSGRPPAAPRCRGHCACPPQAGRAAVPAWSGACFVNRYRHTAAAPAARSTAKCPFPAARAAPCAPAWRQRPHRARTRPVRRSRPPAMRPRSVGRVPLRRAPRSLAPAADSRTRSTPSCTRPPSLPARRAGKHRPPPQDRTAGSPQRAPARPRHITGA